MLFIKTSQILFQKIYKHDSIRTIFTYTKSKENVKGIFEDFVLQYKYLTY